MKWQYRPALMEVPRGNMSLSECREADEKKQIIEALCHHNRSITGKYISGHIRETPLRTTEEIRNR